MTTENTSWSNDEVSDDSEMVMDFDTGAVEPDKLELLPNGKYPVLIEKVESKKTKDGIGKRANFMFKVTDGEYKGRPLFDGINVNLPNSEKAEMIGRKQLAGLLVAVGKKGERKMINLVQCECIAVVKTQPEKDGYEARNVIRGYEPSSGRIIHPTAAVEGTEEQKKSTPGFMQKKAGAGGPPQLQK